MGCEERKKIKKEEEEGERRTRKEGRKEGNGRKRKEEIAERKSEVYMMGEVRKGRKKKDSV